MRLNGVSVQGFKADIFDALSASVLGFNDSSIINDVFY
jgi:hypothetical protein